MIQSPHTSLHLSARLVHGSSARASLLAVACLAVLLFSWPFLPAQGPMDDLSRPQQGRSMRATSSFRGKAGGKTRFVNGKTRLVYDPTADYLSDPTTESSNSENFTVEPEGKHVLLEAEGPGSGGVKPLWKRNLRRKIASEMLTTPLSSTSAESAQDGRMVKTLDPSSRGQVMKTEPPRPALDTAPPSG